jgi:hypothetical protein
MSENILISPELVEVPQYRAAIGLLAAVVPPKRTIGMDFISPEGKVLLQGHNDYPLWQDDTPPLDLDPYLSQEMGLPVHPRAYVEGTDLEGITLAFRARNPFELHSYVVTMQPLAPNDDRTGRITRGLDLEGPLRLKISYGPAADYKFGERCLIPIHESASLAVASPEFTAAFMATLTNSAR